MDMQQRISSLEDQVKELKSLLLAHQPAPKQNKLSLLVFSNDLDKGLAAFILAAGAAAMEMEVVMFFSFWGTSLLRKNRTGKISKNLSEALFAKMLPKGAAQAKLSKMNLGGLGIMMLKRMMRKKNVASLDEMIQLASELGVKIYVCQMSMHLMGFDPGEMMDYPELEFCGVPKFLQEAGGSSIQLFI